MVEFELTEEQKAFQTLAREFAQREIIPVSAELDKTPIVDTQDPAYWNPALFKSPKPFISECASRVAHLAMEIHGGYAVMKEVGIEKLVRDALTMLHPDATNTVLRIAIGDALSKSY